MTTFYRMGPEDEPIKVGEARLESGRVVFDPPELREELADAHVLGPGGDRLDVENNPEAWLAALPNAFAGAFFWAVDE